MLGSTSVNRVSWRAGLGRVGAPAASSTDLLSSGRPCPCLLFPPPSPLHPIPPSLQVFVERAVKAVRRMRVDREKRAAEERAERMAAGRTPGECRRPWQGRSGAGRQRAAGAEGLLPGGQLHAPPACCP